MPLAISLYASSIHSLYNHTAKLAPMFQLCLNASSYVVDSESIRPGGANQGENILTVLKSIDEKLGMLLMAVNKEQGIILLGLPELSSNICQFSRNLVLLSANHNPCGVSSPESKYNFNHWCHKGSGLVPSRWAPVLTCSLASAHNILVDTTDTCTGIRLAASIVRLAHMIACMHVCLQPRWARGFVLCQLGIWRKSNYLLTSLTAVYEGVPFLPQGQFTTHQKPEEVSVTTDAASGLGPSSVAGENSDAVSAACHVSQDLYFHCRDRPMHCTSSCGRDNTIQKCGSRACLSMPGFQFPSLLSDCNTFVELIKACA